MKQSKLFLLAMLAGGLVLASCGSKGDTSSTQASSQQTSSHTQSETSSQEQQSSEQSTAQESSEDISSEEESSEEEAPVTLAGKKFKFVKIVEDDTPATFSQYFYAEFGENGEIKCTDRIDYIPDLDPFFSSAIGTYTQDGDSFTFTLTGVYQKGEYHEYPEEMKDAYTNLPGTISGTTITTTFTFGNAEGIQYFHVELELDESEQVKGNRFNFKEYVTTGFTPDQQEMLDSFYLTSYVTFDDEFVYLHAPALQTRIVGFYYQSVNTVFVEWALEVSDEGKEHAITPFSFESTFDGEEIDIAGEGFDGPVYITYSLAE